MEGWKGGGEEKGWRGGRVNYGGYVKKIKNLIKMFWGQGNDAIFCTQHSMCKNETVARLEKRNKRNYKVAMSRSSYLCVHEEHAYIASAMYMVITVNRGMSTHTGDSAYR